MELLINILNGLCLGFGILSYIAGRIMSGIKSGCFYTDHRHAPTAHRLLWKYWDNIHFLETPYWRVTFFGFDALLIFTFNMAYPEISHLWRNILAALLISHGASAAAGVFYQGFINVGNVDRNNVPLKFIDDNENHRMELASPVTNKKRKIPRFWYGRRRIYAAFGGVLMITSGLFLALWN